MFLVLSVFNELHINLWKNTLLGDMLMSVCPMFKFGVKNVFHLKLENDILEMNKVGEKRHRNY